MVLKARLHASPLQFYILTPSVGMRVCNGFSLHTRFCRISRFRLRFSHPNIYSNILNLFVFLSVSLATSADVPVKRLTSSYTSGSLCTCQTLITCLLNLVSYWVLCVTVCFRQHWSSEVLNNELSVGALNTSTWVLNPTPPHPTHKRNSMHSVTKHAGQCVWCHMIVVLLSGIAWLC